jgi:hypothetical protein
MYGAIEKGKEQAGELALSRFRYIFIPADAAPLLCSPLFFRQN